MTEYINIAIIGADPEVAVLRAEPLVEHLFYVVSTLTEIKPTWPLVGFVSGIALDSQPHDPIFLFQFEFTVK
jgi:hypothetical protein